jgi:hypothetical protein
MAISRKLSSYPDVRRVLDAALTHGGVVYKTRDAAGVHTPGSATYWMQRANTFRLLLREEDAKQREDGVGRSKYDELRWRRRCTCVLKDGCSRPGACLGHIIDIQIGVAIAGDLELPSGEALVLPADTLDPVTDDLLEVEDVFRELGLGDPD